MLIRRDLFDELGGFDERLPLTLNDVDLCRRARARGRLVVVTPRARLLHYEALSRGYTVDAPGG
jgi:GT2 family glycosyltransferase